MGDTLGPGAKGTPSQTDPESQIDPDDVTVDELRDRASELEIEGRSSMNKDELMDAINEEEDTDG